MKYKNIFFGIIAMLVTACGENFLDVPLKTDLISDHHAMGNAKRLAIDISKRKFFPNRSQNISNRCPKNFSNTDLPCSHLCGI